MTRHSSNTPRFTRPRQPKRTYDATRPGFLAGAAFEKISSQHLDRGPFTRKNCCKDLWNTLSHCERKDLKLIAYFVC